MSLPHFEVAVGTIDGTNTLFSVSMGYVPGTLAVFLNGQLKVGGDDDGWEETDPVAGTFTMNTAPETCDVVQAFYIDSAPALPGTELTPLFGFISDTGDIFGQIGAPTSIIGEVEGLSGLLGLVQQLTPAEGVVQEVAEISGVLELG